MTFYFFSTVTTSARLYGKLHHPSVQLPLKAHSKATQLPPKADLYSQDREIAPAFGLNSRCVFNVKSSLCF